MCQQKKKRKELYTDKQLNLPLQYILASPYITQKEDADHFPKLFQLHWNEARLVEFIWRINNILIFLLLTIYLYNKYMYNGQKGKYIWSNDGTFTRWRHYVIKGLHNPINKTGAKFKGYGWGREPS